MSDAFFAAAMGAAFRSHDIESDKKTVLIAMQKVERSAVRAAAAASLAENQVAAEILRAQCPHTRAHKLSLAHGLRKLDASRKIVNPEQPTKHELCNIARKILAFFPPAPKPRERKVGAICSGCSKTADTTAESKSTAHTDTTATAVDETATITKCIATWDAKVKVGQAGLPTMEQIRRAVRRHSIGAMCEGCNRYWCPTCVNDYTKFDPNWCDYEDCERVSCKECVCVDFDLEHPNTTPIMDMSNWDPRVLWGQCALCDAPFCSKHMQYALCTCEHTMCRQCYAEHSCYGKKPFPDPE